MLGFFKQKKWMTESISELSGSFNGLQVIVNNLPCLRDPDSGSRKYIFKNFGFEFITELTEIQLGDHVNLTQLLNSGNTKTVYVSVRDLAPITVSLKGVPAQRKAEFYSDVADSLIAAFSSIGLKP